MLAIGCYAAMERRGIECPNQLSVTGFNDMPFVDRLRPPLTTIRIPHYEMGAAAARILLRQIEMPGSPAQAEVLPCELIVRGSTAPVCTEAR